MTEQHFVDQKELIEIVSAKPQNFAWFLGAGASHSAGLSQCHRPPLGPQAALLLPRGKSGNHAPRTSRTTRSATASSRSWIRAVFPAEWADKEYETYFEKLFGGDKEKQRRYLHQLQLAEDKVRLAAGHRVMGALISLGLCRVAFSTNFDTVVEKAVAAMGGKSLSAYHLEGAYNAKQRLNNEKYPFYCKLHGDFRYDSLKNLPADLATQNANFRNASSTRATVSGSSLAATAVAIAASSSCSGKVLGTPNPFPHGLYWAHLKGSKLPAAVPRPTSAPRRAKGVNAEHRGDRDI